MKKGMFKRIPTAEEKMLIRKAGYEPMDWFVLKEWKESLLIINKEGQKEVISK